MPTTTTYALTERALVRALHTAAPADLPTLAEARSALAAERHALGLSNAPSPILSAESDIEKLGKGEGRLLAALALVHADNSGWNLCPYSGACADGCVATSGNAQYPRVMLGRQARTNLLMRNPRAFLTLLVTELDKLDLKTDGRFGCRLNAFSDIRWERVLPIWFWDRYSSAIFYDYTKHPLRSRPVDSMPDNYVLTYSRSEKSTDAEVAKNLAAQRNVAVVVAAWAQKIKGTTDYLPIPDELFGRPTVDGDKSDRRYEDPVGSVVVLRRKGQLKRDSPFVLVVA